ncbi:hypothetical protein DRN48_09350, partial [Thermococci archaeon]
WKPTRKRSSKSWGLERSHQSALCTERLKLQVSACQSFREVPEGFKGAWFGSKRTNLRHNITSTYFEGEKAELASHGYSRDRRPDKKQVTIGVAWE